jgi:glycosyltransferase involved in cell wall biosynthesis
VIIGLPHPPPAVGGAGSFQLRITTALKEKGHTVVYPEDMICPDVILIVGGTIRLDWIHYCKRRGARVVQRLDGLNWRHKVTWNGFRYLIMSQIRNKILVYIRNQLADEVVYQSEFIQKWWHKVHGLANGCERIIYNAVDLNLFHPSTKPNVSLPVMISVEGNIQDDSVTISTAQHLAANLLTSGTISAFRIYGQIGHEARKTLARIPGVELRGLVPREDMPMHFRECDLFLNLEINPPCPNSVIEALASGLPVIGYDTGSLAELTGGAGCLASYGGDPWRLQKPPPELLIVAARRALAHLPTLSESARAEACRRFSLSTMVESYLLVLEGVN